MTKVNITVELDLEWTDCILITAFDGQYGACWYWVNDEDTILNVTLVAAMDRDKISAAVIDLYTGDVSDYRVRVLSADGRTAHLDADALSWAATKVLKDYAHTDAADQLREALRTPDELPDLDAFAADLLVQVALFGEAVYG